jgi:hypothetical protein
MTTLAEMVEAMGPSSYDERVRLTAGLRAVLEMHVKPMIAEAYRKGSSDGQVYLRGTNEYTYAERAITALTGNDGGKRE